MEPEHVAGFEPAVPEPRGVQAESEVSFCYGANHQCEFVTALRNETNLLLLGGLIILYVFEVRSATERIWTAMTPS